jgi:hypothetical protein
MIREDKREQWKGEHCWTRMPTICMYLYCTCTFFSSPLFNPNTRTPSINVKVKIKTDIINDHSFAFVTTGSKLVAIGRPQVRSNDAQKEHLKPLIGEFGDTVYSNQGIDLYLFFCFRYKLFFIFCITNASCISM